MQTGNVLMSILTDGDRTVVEAALHTYRHRSVPAIASSSREPGDKSDPKIGEALAIARALRKIASKLEREAGGTMKHREDTKKHAREIGKAEADANAYAPPPWFPPANLALPCGCTDTAHAAKQFGNCSHFANNGVSETRHLTKGWPVK